MTQRIEGWYFEMIETEETKIISGQSLLEEIAVAAAELTKIDRKKML